MRQPGVEPGSQPFSMYSLCVEVDKECSPYLGRLYTATILLAHTYLLSRKFFNLSKASFLMLILFFILPSCANDFL